MGKLIAVATLTAAMIAFAPGAKAQLAPAPLPPPSPPLPRTSVGPGPWVVGGVALSALSVIVRAAVVGNRCARQLTYTEAWGAIGLPFFWAFEPPDPCFSSERTHPSQPTFYPPEPTFYPPEPTFRRSRT